MLATNSFFSPAGMAAGLSWMESPRTGSITSTWRCLLLELTYKRQKAKMHKRAREMSFPKGVVAVTSLWAVRFTM